MKISFLGAGSTVFAKNILGDCILSKELGEFEIALHDIDEKRLCESETLINAVNNRYDGKASVKSFLDRKKALENSDFIVNAVQIGGYKPCTVTDFKIPRRYGLSQTIGDTLGIGGIMRGLRTIPFLDEVAKDIEEVCPNALFLNYVNPMAILTGHMLKYTKINAVGLCHSVQGCVPELFKILKMKDKLDGVTWDIYGINHQAWLVDVKDKFGNDLYPEIKERSRSRKGLLRVLDLVRREIMETFDYYVTESSVHNAEYMPYFIKSRYPELILKYCILLNEYPRRCRYQIYKWKKQSKLLTAEKTIEHTRSNEYGSRIIESVYTKTPYSFHGSVLNTDSLIPNLTPEACVEVPINIENGILIPQKCNPLPQQCAALNMTNINVQLLTLKANQTRDIKDVQHAAMLDPHTAAELSLNHIKNMCVDLYKQHRKDGFLPEYKL